MTQKPDFNEVPRQANANFKLRGLERRRGRTGRVLHSDRKGTTSERRGNVGLYSRGAVAVHLASL